MGDRLMPDLSFNRFVNLLQEYGRRLDRLERYAATGRFLLYTPTIGATTTAPTLGAGSSFGSWSRMGNWVYARGIITFGAGMTAGSGTYRIGIPVPARLPPGVGTVLNLGHVRMAQGGIGSTAATASDLLFADNTSYFTLRYPAGSPTGVDTAVTNTTPWVWASGHSIQFQTLYEAYE